MFGDIVEAIQLYNSLVSLYVCNSFVPSEVKKKAGTKSLRTKKSAKDKAVDENVKINEIVLEYSKLSCLKNNFLCLKIRLNIWFVLIFKDSFLRMIKTCAAEQDREAYCDLIRNLLKILFLHEEFHKVSCKIKSLWKWATLLF